MPMVKKDGKMIPAFAADGKGKMKRGGAVKKKRVKKAGGGLVFNVRGQGRVMSDRLR